MYDEQSAKKRYFNDATQFEYRMQTHKKLRHLPFDKSLELFQVSNLKLFLHCTEQTIPSCFVCMNDKCYNFSCSNLGVTFFLHMARLIIYRNEVVNKIQYDSFLIYLLRQFEIQNVLYNNASICMIKCHDLIFPSFETKINCYVVKTI